MSHHFVKTAWNIHCMELYLLLSHRRFLFMPPEISALEKEKKLDTSLL